MRIDCEACGAPFAVDESRIPESGARASCPRCRHQVILRRPTVAVPPPDPLALQFDRTPGSGYSTSVTTDGGRQGTGERTLVPLPPDPLERDATQSGDYAVPDALSAAIASAVGRISGTYAAPTSAAEASLNQAMGLVPPTHVTAEMTPITGPSPAFGVAPGYDAPPAWTKTPIYGTLPPGVPPPGSSVARALLGEPSTPPMFGAPGHTPPFPMTVPLSTMAPTTAPPAPPPAMAPAPPPGPSAYPADAFKSFDVDDLFTTMPGEEVQVEHTAPPITAPTETDPDAELSAKFLRGESRTDPHDVDDVAPAEIVKTGPVPLNLTGPNGRGLFEQTGPILEPMPAEADEWRIRKPESIVEGPFTGQELLSRYEAGLIQPGDLVAQGSDSFRPLSAYAFTSGFARVRTPIVREVKAFASTESGGFPWRGLLTLLAIVGGAAAGAFLYSARPTWLFGVPIPAADAGALAIIQSWREKESPSVASAGELFQLARGYYASDTRDGYRRAADAYKRVLIKTPTDIKAMCGYAEVRAVLAIEEGDGLGLQESAEILGYALRNGGQGAGPHVARANLLVATGTTGDLLSAQSEAGLARRIAPEDPDVLLAVGRAFVMTNAEYALEAVEKAHKLLPDSRQVPVLLGQCYLQLGRIAEARAEFELRKKMVPGDATADLLLANLDASIGRFDRARTRLALAGRENPSAVDVRIQLAIIAYEVDNDLKTAHEELARLRTMQLDRKHKLKVLIHSAAVAQEMGNVEEAEAMIKAGQELDSDSAPLQFRLALLRIAQGKADDALVHLKRASEQMTDRAQYALLLGRIDAALGKLDDAEAQFTQAMFFAPHDVTAYLLSAAVYAQVGAEAQALTLTYRSLFADPAYRKSHRELTEYHDPGSSLAMVVGAFQALSSGQDEPGLTESALAVARYHAGDVPGAEKAALAAVSTGDGALAARVYLAQIALDRNNPQDAIKQLKQAAELDNRVPIVPYLTGRALAQLGRYDEAHARFRQAIDRDLSFLPAVVRDAEVLAHIGMRDESLAAYKKAFKSDPDDLDVRRGLDALEQGELPPTLDVPIEVESEPAP